MTSKVTFQLSAVWRISEMPLLSWRVSAWLKGEPGAGIRALSRGSRRKYPGQALPLGHLYQSSGMWGIPKDWSKRRLPWYQSRKGSQLGLRRKVKGMRRSAMVRGAAGEAAGGAL